MWRQVVSAARRAARGAMDVDYRVKKDTVLYTFSTAQDVAAWDVFEDRKYGGLSTGTLVLQPDEEAALFSGSFSTEIPEGTETRLVKSGFVGIRAHGEGGSFLDLEHMDALQLRIRGDGRHYIASLRTEGMVAVPGRDEDLWQSVLPAPKGEWADVTLPLGGFLATHRGRVLEEGIEAMNPGRVLSLGISLAGGRDLQPAGRFALELAWIKGLRTEDRYGRRGGG